MALVTCVAAVDARPEAVVAFAAAVVWADASDKAFAVLTAVEALPIAVLAAEIALVAGVVSASEIAPMLVLIVPTFDASPWIAVTEAAALVEDALAAC